MLSASLALATGIGYGAWHIAGPPPAVNDQALSAQAGELFGENQRVRENGDPEAIFAARNPDAYSNILPLLPPGADFKDFAGNMIAEDSFLTDRRDRESLLKEFVPPGGRRPAVIVGALREILSFADKAGHDEAARQFVTGLAKLKAHHLYERNKQTSFSNRFPDNPLKTGEYWDMASGMNAGYLLLGGLDKGTNYNFFEIGEFPSEFLNEVIRLAREDGFPGAARARVVNQDVMKLKPPTRTLSVIRAKNVSAYVPGFQDKLGEMIEWLSEGGQLIVENDPTPEQRRVILEDLTSLAQKLIKQGWNFQFRLVGDPGGTHNQELDTLIFTKPKKDSLPTESATWGKYLRRIRDAYHR